LLDVANLLGYQFLIITPEHGRHLPINSGQAFIVSSLLVVENDEAGYFVASVPELPGCHTQAKTLDELMVRVKEAIARFLVLEVLLPQVQRFLLFVRQLRAAC
jgi:predicted RNase H-like HicB family nuclease